MPEVHTLPGLVEAGVKQNNGKTVVKKPDRRYNSGSTHSSRSAIKPLSEGDLFIFLREDLINSFLSSLARIAKNDAERRDLVRRLVVEAGYSDLLATDNVSCVSEYEGLKTAILDTRPDFSQKPPRKWHDRNTGESLENFLKKEYGSWIGKGLIQADIRKQDIHLYYAMTNWRTKTKGDISKDLGIPSKKEITERILESAEKLDDSAVEAASRWRERVRSRNRRTRAKDDTSAADKLSHR